jgi:putative DNA primase/helicase
VVLVKLLQESPAPKQRSSRPWGLTTPSANREPDIADPNACILTTEMLEAFNHWLQINKHNPWPKETFGPRFEQHAETIRHRVTVTRTLWPKGLSRYGLLASAGSPPPARPRVYQGVRFRDGSDIHDF